MAAKYGIIDQDYVRVDAATSASIHRVVIQADTAADIPEPSPNWALGSICIIADTGEYKRLNTEREWV